MVTPPRTFEVDVQWVMYATVQVEADSAEHARQKVMADGEARADGSFLTGSFEVIDVRDEDEG